MLKAKDEPVFQFILTFKAQKQLFFCVFCEKFEIFNVFFKNLLTILIFSDIIFKSQRKSNLEDAMSTISDTIEKFLLDNFESEVLELTIIYN